MPSKLADRPNDARGDESFGLTENRLFERDAYSHGLKTVMECFFAWRGVIYSKGPQYPTD